MLKHKLIDIHVETLDFSFTLPIYDSSETFSQLLERVYQHLSNFLNCDKKELQDYKYLKNSRGSFFLLETAVDICEHQETIYLTKSLEKAISLEKPIKRGFDFKINRDISESEARTALARCFQIAKGRPNYHIEKTKEGFVSTIDVHFLIKYCGVECKDIIHIGKANSKKESQGAAAQSAIKTLVDIGVLKEIQQPNSLNSNMIELLKSSYDPITTLQIIVSKLNGESVSFTISEDFDQYKAEVEIQQHLFEGCGNTKEEAKKDASLNALHYLCGI